MDGGIGVFLFKSPQISLCLSTGRFKWQTQLTAPNLIQPPPNPRDFSRDFFFLKVSQLTALLRLYSGFLFLAYFSPPSFSLSHTHIHFLLKTRPSETLCPHSYNSQENFHMPLFWAVTICICFDFSPPPLVLMLLFNEDRPAIYLTSFSKLQPSFYSSFDFASLSEIF